MQFPRGWASVTVSPVPPLTHVPKEDWVVLMLGLQSLHVVSPAEEEQLFRSVEGQAASEEEEEERWQEKPGRPQAHSEAPLLQPSSCVSR